RGRAVALSAGLDRCGAVDRRYGSDRGDRLCPQEFRARAAAGRFGLSFLSLWNHGPVGFRIILFVGPLWMELGIARFRRFPIRLLQPDSGQTTSLVRHSGQFRPRNRLRLFGDLAIQGSLLLRSLGLAGRRVSKTVLCVVDSAMS